MIEQVSGGSVGKNARIRSSAPFLVVRSGRGASPGRLVEYEDGRWRMWLAGWPEPIAGDRFEGGRAAAAALLRATLRPPPPE